MSVVSPQLADGKSRKHRSKRGRRRKQRFGKMLSAPVVLVDEPPGSSSFVAISNNEDSPRTTTTATATVGFEKEHGTSLEWSRCCRFANVLQHFPLRDENSLELLRRPQDLGKKLQDPTILRTLTQHYFSIQTHYVRLKMANDSCSALCMRPQPTALLGDDPPSCTRDPHTAVSALANHLASMETEYTSIQQWAQKQLEQLQRRSTEVDAEEKALHSLQAQQKHERAHLQRTLDDTNEQVQRESLLLHAAHAQRRVALSRLQETEGKLVIARELYNRQIESALRQLEVAKQRHEQKREQEEQSVMMWKQVLHQATHDLTQSESLIRELMEEQWNCGLWAGVRKWMDMERTWITRWQALLSVP